MLIKKNIELNTGITSLITSLNFSLKAEQESQ